MRLEKLFLFSYSLASRFVQEAALIIALELRIKNEAQFPAKENIALHRVGSSISHLQHYKNTSRGGTLNLQTLSRALPCTEGSVKSFQIQYLYMQREEERGRERETIKMKSKLCKSRINLMKR